MARLVLRLARNATLWLGLGLIAIGVSGCSQPAIYVETYGGYPAEAGPRGPLDEEPAVYWTENGERIAVVTLGSSSCPNRPESIEVVSPTKLEIEIRRSGGPLCTADISAQTYEIPLPSGLDPQSEITVDIGPVTTQTLTPLVG